MKKFLLASLAIVLTASLSGASVLQTAITPQKGKWGIAASYFSTSNYGGYSNFTLSGIGATVAYDINDNLGASLTYSPLTPGGNLTLLVPAAGGNVTYDAGGNGAAYNLTFKYSILNEFAGKPVSLAARLNGYSASGTLNFTATNPALPALNVSSTANITSVSGGIIISKLIHMFIPYCALSYGSTSLSLGNAALTGALPSSSYSINLVAGTGIAFSEKLAILLEYESSSSNSGYSSPTIAALIGYTLN